MAVVVLSAAVSLQAISLLVACRLWSLAQRQWPWALAAVALGLIFLGRSVALFHSLNGTLTEAPNLAAEIVSFSIALVVTTALLKVLRREADHGTDQPELASLPSLLANAKLGSWQWNSATNRIALSPEMHELWGEPETRVEISTGDFVNRIHPDDRDDVRRAIGEAINGTSVYSPEYRVQWPDGAIRWLADYGTIERGFAGKVTRMCAIVQDITLKKQLELRLRAREARLAAAIRSAELGVWDWDLKSNRVALSAEWSANLGYTTQEVLESFADFEAKVHPDDRAQTLAALMRVAGGEDHRLKLRHRLLMADNSYAWFIMQGQTLSDAGGPSERIVGTHTRLTPVDSITEIAPLDAAGTEPKLLTASPATAIVTPDLNSDLIDVLMNASGEAAAVTDETGEVIRVNAAFEDLFPVSARKQEPWNLATTLFLIDEYNGKPVSNLIRYCFPSAEMSSADCGALLHRANGKDAKLRISARAVHDKQGHIARIVFLFRYAPERPEAQDRTNNTGSHDSLTGLADRSEFEKRLSRLLATAEPRLPRTLLYLDLHKFDLVNTLCGRIAGDALLSHCANIFRDRLRNRDTLARLGGDKFGVLLEHCLIDEALRIAEQLRSALADAPFTWHDQTFHPDASIGLLPIPNGRHSWVNVLSVAEHACNMAKNQSDGRVHVLKYDDEDASNYMRELRWLPKIQEAISRQRFHLFYQPARLIVSSDSDDGYGEILLRMLDSDGKYVAPKQFIPAAERYEQMHAIDRWVVENTFAYLQQADRSASLAPTIAINISGQSVGNRDFHRFVSEQLRRFHIPPERLCFEITETAAISEISNAIQFMTEFKEQGCHFALDDFGCGLSSFGYLKNLPVDFLKIDGSFVKDMGTDKVDEAMVTAMHNIGQILGIRTIAESVENEDTVRKLRTIGVHFAQGFHIDPPRPLGL